MVKIKENQQSDAPILLIDIDDTVEDLNGAWIYWLDTVYNLSVKPKDILDWDITKFFPTLLKEQIYEPLYRECFWKTVKPIAQAPFYTKLLMQEGYRVYFCTASDFYPMVYKWKWVFERYFPFVDQKQIIVASDKSLVRADFRIDDGIHNLKGIDDGCTKILFSAPYNKKLTPLIDGFDFRAGSWTQVYHIITDHEKDS